MDLEPLNQRGIDCLERCSVTTDRFDYGFRRESKERTNFCNRKGIIDGHRAYLDLLKVIQAPAWSASIKPRDCTQTCPVSFRDKTVPITQAWGNLYRIRDYFGLAPCGASDNGIGS